MVLPVNHPATGRIRLSINVSASREIDAESLGNLALKSGNRFRRLEPHVGQISYLRIDSGWNVRIREPSFVDNAAIVFRYLRSFLFGLLSSGSFDFLT